MSDHHTLPTLLVTGFGPFPGAPENPSGQLIKELLKQPPEEEETGANLVFGTLPTSWRKVEEGLRILLQRHDPQFVVHFGYGANSPGLTLERSCFNETCEHQDDRGQAENCGPVIKDGPERYDTPLPVDEIKKALDKAGLASEISHDPGRYLCNKLYYLSLARDLPALFIHIPALETANRLYPAGHKGNNRLDVEQAARALTLIARTIIRSSDPAII